MIGYISIGGDGAFANFLLAIQRPDLHARELLLRRDKAERLAVAGQPGIEEVRARILNIGVYIDQAPNRAELLIELIDGGVVISHRPRGEQCDAPSRQVANVALLSLRLVTHQNGYLAILGAVVRAVVEHHLFVVAKYSQSGFALGGHEFFRRLGIFWINDLNHAPKINQWRAEAPLRLGD